MTRACAKLSPGPATSTNNGVSRPPGSLGSWTWHFLGKRSKACAWHRNAEASISTVLNTRSGMRNIEREKTLVQPPMTSVEKRQIHNILSLVYIRKRIQLRLRRPLQGTDHSTPHGGVPAGPEPNNSK